MSIHRCCCRRRRCCCRMMMMKQFGAKVSSEDDKVFRVQPSSYVSPGNMFIEGGLSLVWGVG